MILSVIFQFVMAYIATICFGVILNIPHQAFNSVGLIGGVSWAFYWVLSHNFGIGIAFGNLAAALLISVLSMYAARYKKMPVIIFNIPSLVSFVPGGQAYKMVRNFAIGNPDLAWSYFMQVVVIAGAIAMGFALGELYHQVGIYNHLRVLKRR
ncbi:threonine/serine exporter family protein [Paucilactobacillus suebicus]|uniref:Threonine/Serine exporter ThrE domain-containing protein n=1 Tax=Paucilactobacillus suebicus DSM 5007 = KCTC 3549 TaxID=1423807 RepID=A0A0R1WEW9_9LACO|nr:hypothetical protein FD16_GL000870 [Paucilactobacillus suebicus DSM 5007 = KCTC 3549]